LVIVSSIHVRTGKRKNPIGLACRTITELNPIEVVRERT
jgi:hypothetical protein